MSLLKKTAAGICRLIEGGNNTAGQTNEAARAAWLQDKLKRIPPGGRILDAGAGEQRLKTCCLHLKYVAQDFAQYDGRGDSRGLQTGAWDQTKLDIISDITAIPEPDGSFDAIMCVEVLEHLPNPLLAIAEFSRLMRPGGHLILTAPFSSLTHFAPYHFCTGFNRYYYEYHLPTYGFRILELAPNGNYFECLAQELRRLPEIGRRYARVETSICEKVVLRLLLRTLCRLSRTGGESCELLHYGYHLFAQKTGHEL